MLFIPPVTQVETGQVTKAAAAAQTVTGVPAVELFALADHARLAGRLADAEAIYRALIRDADGEIRSEARFRLARLLREQGRRVEAATLYRAILDERPGATAVRLELARTLSDLGEVIAAARQLRQAQAAGLPPDVARLVDQYATALRSLRPYGATVELAIAPDSNVNRATDTATLDTIIAPLTLSPDARARSGIGGHIVGQVFARLPVTTTLSLLPRLSGNAELYRLGRFNDQSVQGQIGLERAATLGGRMTVSAGYGWRWYGQRPFARTGTASIDFLRPIGGSSQVTVGASIGQARYTSNALQDGMIATLDTGWERAMSARTGGSVTLSVSRQTARDPGYASVAGGVTALLFHDLGRVTVIGAATVRHLEGDARLFLFPERRQDWLGRVSVSGTFRQATVRGFAPLLRWSLERNRSTVGLYAYRRIAMEIGVSRAF